MTKSKHRPDADVLILDYIEQQADFAKSICVKLRGIILSSDKSIIEDWKWGPNYYADGMVCGFGAFKRHVSLVFFQGALLKDEKKILVANPGNIHNRHIRFTDVSQIKSSIIKGFIKESIRNNRQGKKVGNNTKEIEIPQELISIFKKKKLLTKFKNLTYYKRKEFINWFLTAKREDTRTKRLAKIVEMVSKDTFLY
jgi:uncharacterized protein YdeI (YjbR/CyaY-like superfamily)